MHMVRSRRLSPPPSPPLVPSPSGHAQGGFGLHWDLNFLPAIGIREDNKCSILRVHGCFQHRM